LSRNLQLKKNRNQFCCISELKQRFDDVWQSAAERYLLTRPTTSGEINGQHVFLQMEKY